MKIELGNITVLVIEDTDGEYIGTIMNGDELVDEFCHEDYIMCQTVILIELGNYLNKGLNITLI